MTTRRSVQCREIHERRRERSLNHTLVDGDKHETLGQKLDDDSDVDGEKNDLGVTNVVHGNYCIKLREYL